MLAPPAAYAAPSPVSASPWHAGPGPYAVVTTDLALTDPARDKQLELRVQAPRGIAGTAPVVVFSHGAGGGKRAFTELSEHWASWGYVVLHPVHADSLLERRRNGETERRLRRDARALPRLVDPFDRRQDVVFLLDHLTDVEARLGGVRLDRQRIAMAGHSAGALTTQILAGVRFRDRAGRMRDAGDPRIRAAILISGQGMSRHGLTADSWRALDLPMLTITGSQDFAPGNLGETPTTRQQPFVYARPGDKYLLFLQGATHSSYQGRDGFGDRTDDPPKNLRTITEATASATLAFLDAYLKTDAEARAYVASDALARWGNGDVRWEKK